MSIPIFQFISPPGNHKFIFYICNSIRFVYKFFCTLLTSFNLDGVLGGPSADAATLGGWGVNTHTHFRETYWHILWVHSSFTHFNTRSGVCYILLCTSLFHLLFISWKPGRFRRNPASSLKSLQIITAGEVWRKGNHPILTVGMRTGSATVENGYGGSLRNQKWNYHGILQSHSWAYIWKRWKHSFEKMHGFQCS